MYMSEILQNPEVLQQQETNKQQIETVYGTIDDFWDFQILLQSLDISLQKEIESLLVAQKDNPDLKNELDWMAGGSFPTKASEVRYLLEKYSKVNNKTENIVQEEKDQAQEEKAQAQEEKDQAQEEKDQAQRIHTNIKIEQAEIQTEKQKIIETLQSIRIPWVDIYSDLQAAGIDINSDFDAAKFNEFCQNNVWKYLEKAQEYSPQTFVQTYESFAQISASETVKLPALDAILAQYNTEYQTTKLALENRKVSFPRDTDAIQLALWDSAISKIVWDTIYGENGEVIDISRDTPTLSLRWKDGVMLEVWDIRVPDTRKQELEITKLEQGISQLQAQIDFNTSILNSYINTTSSKFLENPAYIETFLDSLLSAGVDRKLIESVDEAWLVGETLLRELRKYFETSNTNLKSDIALMERRAWVLKLQIETMNRLAREEIRQKKERVRSTQEFFKSVGISRIITQMMEIFPLITDANSIKLPSGNSISSINISTLEMKWNFSPALWEGGAEDLQTRKIIAELINQVLSEADDNELYSIDFSSMWEPIFKKWEMVIDAMLFEAYVANLIGDVNFRSIALRRLWLIKE